MAKDFDSAFCDRLGAAIVSKIEKDEIVMPPGAYSVVVADMLRIDHTGLVAGWIRDIYGDKAWHYLPLPAHWIKRIQEVLSDQYRGQDGYFAKMNDDAFKVAANVILGEE